MVLDRCWPGPTWSWARSRPLWRSTAAARGAGFWPVVQLIKDWNNQPESRVQMLAGGPPEDTDAVVAAKIAAVVHALCQRDGHPPPTWVNSARSPVEVALVPDVDLSSPSGQRLSDNAPGSAATTGSTSRSWTCARHDRLRTADSARSPTRRQRHPTRCPDREPSDSLATVAAMAEASRATHPIHVRWEDRRKGVSPMPGGYDGYFDSLRWTAESTQDAPASQSELAARMADHFVLTESAARYRLSFLKMVGFLSVGKLYRWLRLRAA